MSNPRTQGLHYSPWQPLGIPSAITPIGQLHQSPPSPIPGDRVRGKRRGFSPRAAARHRSPNHQKNPSSDKNSSSDGKRSQSPVNMLEHRDTYGQAQVCRKGHQGSSVDRPCQPSFQPQSIQLRLSVLVRNWDGQGE